MPIFDIEGMVKKELDRALEVEVKMLTLLKSGKIEEWCGGCADAIEEVKNEMNKRAESINKYAYILTDLLEGYQDTHATDDLDKWEGYVKARCGSATRFHNKTDSDPTEGD